MWINFASKNEIDVIVNMEKECFGDRAWNRDMMESDFDKSSNYIICYTNDDEPIGYLAFLDLGNECEILRIGVRKQFRKQGNARALLDFMFDYCIDNKKERIFLGVSSLNSMAISLYKKAGFNLINTRKNYYAQGEDALNYIKLL